MSEHKDRPTFVFNFNDKVGQNIANVEHMEVHFDKDMQMQVANVEEMKTPANTTREQGGEVAGSNGSEKPLCVVLNKTQRQMLEVAEKNGIIVYNNVRNGYDKGLLASQALVAYLCGKVFCGDFTKDGVWMEGKRFDDAQYCELLFGFDVAGTRRSTRGKGGGKSPIGWEKIDELFAEN